LDGRFSQKVPGWRSPAVWNTGCLSCPMTGKQDPGLWEDPKILRRGFPAYLCFALEGTQGESRMVFRQTKMGSARIWTGRRSLSDVPNSSRQFPEEKVFLDRKLRFPALSFQRRTGRKLAWFPLFSLPYGRYFHREMETGHWPSLPLKIGKWFGNPTVGQNCWYTGWPAPHFVLAGFLHWIGSFARLSGR
jgi:hypothetical protein